MAFQACATVTPVEDCSCTDGTTLGGGIITGAWIGWFDAAAGSTIQDIAAITCPDDPHTVWRLWGSAWDFDLHATSPLSPLDCPASTDGLTPILWGGSYDQHDLEAVPIESTESGCIGGAFFISANDLGIITIPTDGGTGTDCTQEGGSEMLLVEIVDACGNQLVPCPFPGVIGAQFECTIADFCADWNIIEVAYSACGEDGGSTTISVDLTKREGDCDLVGTLTIDGTPYVLGSSPAHVEHEVSPCSPGQSVTITLTRVHEEGCLYSCPDITEERHVTL
jgi:hypothetical protein